MPRPKLTDAERARGEQLAQALTRARERSKLSQDALATEAGVALDSLRKIEQAHIASPGFFVVADLASRLNITLDELAANARRTR